MTLLSANNVSRVFGAEEIFSDISLDVPPRARIALVGPNGAGKTTLVNILMGVDLPTEGQVRRAKGLDIGFLPQRPEMVGTHTLWEEQLRAFEPLREMERELSDLAAKMADPDTHDAALAAYGPLQERFELAGGYTYETRIKMVLTGLSFSLQDYQLPLNHLSGGQKTRALLGRLLLEEPDLLILDEPTNHLDIQAVEWLEDYLQSFPGAVLAISHDRYFIDHFASTVWELEFGRMETYRGNYTHYMEQREARRERLQKEFEAQQAFIAKEEDYIRKHMGSRWTAQAKGRLKKLETMKRRGDIIERGPQHRKSMKLRMVASARSGDRVLMARGLRVGYDQPLFTVPDVTVYRGETVAVIGPNGAGKTTLLKTLVGSLTPLAGESKLGAQVKIGYFAQAHEELNPNRTIIDEIQTIKPMKLSEARNYLGMFLFSGDDVFRPVDTLSGGERGRVALAKLSLSGANLLLLDEPTNHLDIDSQEILQAVLEDYGGTCLLVSHDRYLISALATQIWYVEQGKLEIFDGTYEEFVAARNQRLQETSAADEMPRARSAANVAEKVNGLNPYEVKKRVATLEDTIHRLEHELEELNEQLSAASAAGDAAKVAALGEAYTRTESELETAMHEWETLAETL